MLVITATREVEIRRIEVQIQSGQNVSKTSSQPTVNWGDGILVINRKIAVQATPSIKTQHCIGTITETKRSRDVAQVVECLPSKHKALSSNPQAQVPSGWAGGKAESGIVGCLQ
jgi:hypothetical protein